MARPRSVEKRKALLEAATEIFSKRGLSAPTASVTETAGLAEGTLFVYFKDKDDLINCLYQELKKDLAQAILSNYPNKASIQNRTKHLWNKYVEWGIQNPKQIALLHKLKVWEGLKPETREASMAHCTELQDLIETAIKDNIFRKVPREFVTTMLSAQAEATMQFMKNFPKQANFYKDKGFEIFWNGICQ